jgi:hypothetical protein
MTHDEPDIKAFLLAEDRPWASGAHRTKWAAGS